MQAYRTNIYPLKSILQDGLCPTEEAKRATIQIAYDGLIIPMRDRYEAFYFSKPDDLEDILKTGEAPKRPIDLCSDHFR